MKINTEIIQKIFIVTCKGTRLDAAYAQKFFNSMQGFIKKGHMDIVLDLSSVEFVDSTGLGAIVLCLKEVDGRGQFVLCGVNDMVLSLLKMTHLDSIFTQAATRKEAIKKLTLEKKKKALAQAPVVKPAPSIAEKKGFDESLLASLTMEDGDTAPQTDSRERRKHRRITNKQILNEDIIVHCTNTADGRRTTSVIINISPGGLLLVSPSKLTVGHEFIISGRIGPNFKFRERAVIRNSRDRQYGMEFVGLSEKTRSFLQQLTGSVVLSGGR